MTITPLHELHRQSVTGYRSSAEDWRKVAALALDSDFRLACFAHKQAQENEAQAELVLQDLPVEPTTFPTCALFGGAPKCAAADGA